MNVISFAVIQDIDKALDYLEENGFHALIFKQEKNIFVRVQIFSKSSQQ
jgi:hypothetical protein